MGRRVLSGYILPTPTRSQIVFGNELNDMSRGFAGTRRAGCASMTLDREGLIVPIRPWRRAF